MCGWGVKYNLQNLAYILLSVEAWVSERPLARTDIPKQLSEIGFGFFPNLVRMRSHVLEVTTFSVRAANFVEIG